MSKVSFLKQENGNRIRNTTCRQSPLFSFRYSAVLPRGLLVSWTRKTSNLTEEELWVNVLWVFDDAAVPGSSLGSSCCFASAYCSSRPERHQFQACSMSHFPMRRSGNHSEHTLFWFAASCRGIESMVAGKAQPGNRSRRRKLTHHMFHPHTGSRAGRERRQVCITQSLPLVINLLQ